MILETSHFRDLIRALFIPAVAVLGCAGSCLGQTTLASNSPFAPGSTSGLSAGSVANTYELMGSSVEGPDVSVCVVDHQAKRSQWIQVGGDVNGIRVLSYDPLSDTAVVVIAGSKKVLSMRKSSVAALGPSAIARPAPALVPQAVPAAPIASAPPAVAGSPAQEQREARMLVSDLLEIGIQQRKAYQEAKQKAAAGNPPAPDN
jgi:hypothetical protein